MLEINSFYEYSLENKLDVPTGIFEWSNGIPVNKDGSIDIKIFELICEYFSS